MTRRVILTYEEGGYSPRLKMTPFRFVVFKSLTPFDSNCSMWGHGAGTCPREAPSCRYCALSWKLGMGMKIQNARNRFSKVRIFIGYAWSADRSIMPIPPPPSKENEKKSIPAPRLGIGEFPHLQISIVMALAKLAMAPATAPTGVKAPSTQAPLPPSALAAAPT